MKRSKLLLGTAALMLFCAIATAQEKKAPYDSKELARLSLEIARKVQQSVSALSGTDCNLAAVADNECPILMTVIEVNARHYCVALAPKVNVKRESGTAKFVNWKLEPTVLTAKKGPQPVAFHPDAGIVTTYEKNGHQIDEDKATRGHGKGGGPKQQHRFHVKTLKNAINGEAGYLPVVMWDPEGNGELELCAAIDPKIVNED